MNFPERIELTLTYKHDQGDNVPFPRMPKLIIQINIMTNPIVNIVIPK